MKAVVLTIEDRSSKYTGEKGKLAVGFDLGRDLDFRKVVQNIGLAKSKELNDNVLSMLTRAFEAGYKYALSSNRPDSDVKITWQKV